jgi:hypothetical protein
MPARAVAGQVVDEELLLSQYFANRWLFLSFALSTKTIDF